ncbi:MAG: arsenical pump-driving ATPase [Candidatus Nanopelagicales bacterium]
MDAPAFLAAPPRFLFFTGKGGVGKTSIACATAVHLAASGRSVLLVSTDPASNVGQVFGVPVGNDLTPIVAVPGLTALEIDPEAAAHAYRERVIGPLRGAVPEAEVASMTEQLSGSCTTEVAAFDEFTGLLADTSTYGGFDHIIFDTAPTGHTIRLLQLPGSWTDFLSAGGTASCLGPLSGLEKQRAVYAAAVAALGDPHRTRMVLVARPHTSALREIERTRSELAAIGIASAHVVINGVLPEDAGEEDLARAIRARETAALAGLPAGLAALPRDTLELKAVNMVGVPALRTLLHPSAADNAPPVVPGLPDLGQVAGTLEDLIDELTSSDHALVMCMGKGGVGKTTIAAAIAVALAHRGHPVHLTTTDPAAHLAETLQGAVTGLTVSRIDPVQATAEYRDRVMAAKGKHLDDAGRAALAEDLRSPCTEEVAVFQKFARAVAESRRGYVVIDTAPTGHTLLLLDAAGSYHREIARQMGDSMRYTTPLMHMQDPDRTKVLLITLAEPTPVLEAAELADDLERAGIHPWAWVINNSVAAAQPRSPFLRQRARAEVDQIQTAARHADRIALIPLLAAEPVGETRLAALTGTTPPRQAFHHHRDSAAPVQGVGRR